MSRIASKSTTTLDRAQATAAQLVKIEEAKQVPKSKAIPDDFVDDCDDVPMTSGTPNKAVAKRVKPTGVAPKVADVGFSSMGDEDVEPEVVKKTVGKTTRKSEPKAKAAPAPKTKTRYVAPRTKTPPKAKVTISAYDAFEDDVDSDIEDVVLNPYDDAEDEDEHGFHIDMFDLTEEEEDMGDFYVPMKKLQYYIGGDKLELFSTVTVSSAFSELILVDGDMLCYDDSNGYVYSKETALWEYQSKKTMITELEKRIAMFMKMLHNLRPVIDNYTYDDDDYHKMVKNATKASIAPTFGQQVIDRINTPTALRTWSQKIMKLDQTMDLFPFGMFVINPKTNDVFVREKEHLFTRTTNAVQLSKAKRNPTVDNILNQIFCGNMTKRDYYLGEIGNALCGRGSRTINHMLGGGSNGKSMFNDLLKYMFGSWFFNLSRLALNKSSGQTANSHTAGEIGIEHSRIVRISEAKLTNVDLEYYKELAGSETRIIRGCGGDRKEVPQNFSVFIDTNQILKSDSVPVWDRTKIIRFDARFVDEHELIPDKPNMFVKSLTTKDLLKDERNINYLFTLIMRCAKRLHEKGAKRIPQVIIDDTNAAKGDADYFQQFINDCVIRDPKSAIPAREFYTAFTTWYTTTLGGRLGGVPNNQEFKAAMEYKGFECYKSGTNKYKGGRLVVPE